MAKTYKQKYKKIKDKKTKGNKKIEKIIFLS